MINPYKIKSLLFIPAIEDDFYENIFSFDSKPDGIVFDLEDSIKKGSKGKARRKLSNKLSDGKFREKLFSEYAVFIRVNEINSPWFNEDISVANEVEPDFLMASKVGSGEEVKSLKRQSQADQVFAGVESVSGAENLDQILDSMSNNDLFALGYEDISAELLIERPELNTVNPLTFLLMKALTKSRKHGVPIIDAVSRLYTADKLQRLRAECEYTSGLGFSGKVAIHPNQIETINEVFSDRNEAIRERGKKVLDEFQNTEDKSVITGEEKEMMDTPSRKMYQKWVEKIDF